LFAKTVSLKERGKDFRRRREGKLRGKGGGSALKPVSKQAKKGQTTH